MKKKFFPLIILSLAVTAVFLLYNNKPSQVIKSVEVINNNKESIDIDYVLLQTFLFISNFFRRLGI